MNRNQNPLDRLFRSAAQAPVKPFPANPVSWKTEMQVMAAWRSSVAGASQESWLGILRAGVAIAGITAIATILINWKGDVSSPDDLAATHAEFNVVVMN